MIAAILGSVALNQHHFTREPSDWDILCSYEGAQTFIKQIGKRETIKCNYPTDGGAKILVKTNVRIYELEICWPESNAEKLLELIMVDCMPDLYEGMLVPNLDTLLTIKTSHRYKKDSIFFNKTRKDILLLRSLGAKIPESHKDWLKWRERETYTNALPKLNQSKKDFFDNSSNIYTISHDDIHEAVKHLERPAYEMFKPDSAEVFTSKEMFFKCSEEVRLYAALEEVQVLSIERSIHPFGHTNYRWAFDLAHQKLASSISGGWFREFVYGSYDTVQAMYDEAYVHKFYAALNSGLIKPFEG